MYYLKYWFSLCKGSNKHLSSFYTPKCINKELQMFYLRDHCCDFGLRFRRLHLIQCLIVSWFECDFLFFFSGDIFNFNFRMQHTRHHQVYVLLIVSIYWLSVLNCFSIFLFTVKVHQHTSHWLTVHRLPKRFLQYCFSPKPSTILFWDGNKSNIAWHQHNHHQQHYQQQQQQQKASSNNSNNNIIINNSNIINNSINDRNIFNNIRIKKYQQQHQQQKTNVFWSFNNGKLVKKNSDLFFITQL